MWQLFSYHLWSRSPDRLRVKKVYLPLFRAWKNEKEVHVIACIFSIAERWLSGRRRRSRKPLTGQPVRGFESPSLRQFYSQAFSLQKLTTEKSHLKFWVLYNDVESWCMLLLRMKKTLHKPVCNLKSVWILSHSERCRIKSMWLVINTSDFWTFRKESHHMFKNAKTEEIRSRTCSWQQSVFLLSIK